MNKKLFGWSMYDFANTIFSALFVTVYFPLLVVLKGGNAFHVGLVMGISMLLAGLLVPWLGAIADLTKRKRFMLFIFTVICCIFTFFAGFLNLTMVLLFGLLANFFYHASLDVYDSFLVELSHKKNIGWVSGLGTAIGYLGTIFSVIIAYIVGYLYGYEDITAIQIIFMLTAIFYFGFSIFTFVFVKEISETKIQKRHFKEAFKRVIFTIKEIKKFRFLWIFLLSSFLYMDAANTAIIFLFLYAKDQIGLTLIQFLPIYLIMATSAGLGSAFFGKLTDKLGHKKALNIVLFLWILIILILYMKTNYTTFLIAGILGGALLGALWTITRPILVDLAPRDKIAELFGYQGLTEKFSGVIGPALFGYIAVVLGFKQALLVVIALFLAGFIALLFVKMQKEDIQR